MHVEIKIIKFSQILSKQVEYGMAIQCLQFLTAFKIRGNIFSLELGSAEQKSSTVQLLEKFFVPVPSEGAPCPLFRIQRLSTGEKKQCSATQVTDSKMQEMKSYPQRIFYFKKQNKPDFVKNLAAAVIHIRQTHGCQCIILQ